MRPATELLAREPRARIFFAVLAQSTLGNGAAYVALLLIAYDRFHSPWAIGLVLLADVLPAMVLGPVFGAVADRFSRRTAGVGADVIRALAFAGIALVDGFGPTLALALVAGAGTGLFTPAALAALPSLLDEERRLPAATSLFGAVTDLGFTVGPALAAGLLLLGGPETILLVNGISFAVSAVVLSRLRYGAAPAGHPDGEDRPSLLREARQGLVATAGMRGLRVVLVASATALFFGGIFNVAELLLATEDLAVGEAGYSSLVAVYGVGFILGSLAGSLGGDTPTLKRRYLLGLLVMAIGFGASGVVPSYAGAVAAFAAGGYGNGLVLVYERLLIQALVPDALRGRVFGVKDALTAWAFALAFVAGAGVIAAIGTREMLVLAGLGGVLVWAVTGLALRKHWRSESATEPPTAAAPRTALAGGAGLHLATERRTGQDRTDLVGNRDHWLVLLDDLGEGGHNARIELRPGVRG